MSFWTGTEWAPEPQAPEKRPSRTRHALEAGLEGTLVALVLVGLVAGTTFAARTRTASIQLAGGGGFTAVSLADPSLGDTVFFDLVVPGNINNPRVLVQCYQGGDVVYGEAGSAAQATGDGTDSLGYSGFLLGGGGSVWKTNGGDADCVATLFYWSQKSGKQTFNTLATTEFHANG